MQSQVFRGVQRPRTVPGDGSRGEKLEDPSEKLRRQLLLEDPSFSTGIHVVLGGSSGVEGKP